MAARRDAFIRTVGWGLAAVPVVVLIAIATYDSWGYQRYLAVESYPIANADIYPEFQHAIEYRKRYDWLPGNKLKLVAVDPTELEKIRSSALAAYDWALPELRGTTYCFVEGYNPLPGWKKRSPAGDRATDALN